MLAADDFQRPAFHKAGSDAVGAAALLCGAIPFGKRRETLQALFRSYGMEDQARGVRQADDAARTGNGVEQLLHQRGGTFEQFPAVFQSLPELLFRQGGWEDMPGRQAAGAAAKPRCGDHVADDRGIRTPPTQTALSAVLWPDCAL